MRGRWGRKLKGFYAKYLVMHKKIIDIVQNVKNKDSSKSRGVC